MTPSTTPSADPLKVLVVDDEPGMRTGVARALREFTLHMPEIEGAVHFSVDQAESAEAGLARIAAARPDILLLDHKLPGMSGLDLLEQLGDHTQEILVIMITAYASIEAAVTATKRGAYDFLAKPFTPEELRSVVRKAAGRLLLLRQARRLAEEKRRVRFEFIRVLTHELKAPLNAVEGYLLILKDETLGALPPDYRPLIDRATERIEGMRKLIMDLLDMTRIESGARARTIDPVDLVMLTEECLETVRTAADASRISLTAWGGAWTSRLRGKPAACGSLWPTRASAWTRRSAPASSASSCVCATPRRATSWAAASASRSCASSWISITARSRSQASRIRAPPSR